MRTAKSIFLKLCVFLGCILGSGFVGGKELLLVFEKGSVFSVMVFVMFLCMVVFFVTWFTRKNNIDGLESFSIKVFGKFHFFAQFSLLLCYFVVTATLLATTDDCMRQIFHLDTNAPVFSYLSALFAWLVMKKNTKALEKFNSFAVPLVLIFLVIVYLTNLDKIEFDFSKIHAVSAIGYGLFNFVMMLGILTIPTKDISKKATILLMAIFGVVLLVFAVLQLSLLKNPLYEGFKIPILQAVSENAFLYFVSGVAIVFAILTSLLSNAFPVIQFVDGFVKDFHLSTALVFFLALLLSLAGFDFMVKYCYPIASALGIFTLLAMLISSKRKKVA